MPVTVRAPRDSRALKSGQRQSPKRDGIREAPQLIPLDRLAYHEAGHAVAALWCGQVVERVTILPIPGFAGHAQAFDQEGDTLRKQDAAGRMVVEPKPRAYKARILGLYAGRAGEALLVGERDPRRAFLGRAGDQNDRKQAAETIAALWPSADERQRREQRYRRLALWFVWRYEARIQRVAAALLRFGCLEDAEVEIAADEGARSVAKYRAKWAARDNGRWLAWSAAVRRLRAEGGVRLSAPTEAVAVTLGMNRWLWRVLVAIGGLSAGGAISVALHTILHHPEGIHYGCLLIGLLSVYVAADVITEMTKRRLYRLMLGYVMAGVAAGAINFEELRQRSFATRAERTRMAAAVSLALLWAAVMIFLLLRSAPC